MNPEAKRIPTTIEFRINKPNADQNNIISFELRFLILRKAIRFNNPKINMPGNDNQTGQLEGSRLHKKLLAANVM
ncbi:MAG: hypothetical protein UT05_C0015G0013 [Parcubacteria group bacterium GW2011_GWF2_38_76]|nr:MAG: hypothetical protein UT05_C0015G0013 [Parcubacteria group bacterium GW2011_GWF2_38_76]